MKTEWRIFLIIAGFLLFATFLYGGWTWAEADGRVEWIGTVALLLSFLLCAMCGGFFWFVSRRIDLRPEDRPDAEIADGAGEIGFFSPGSYWPFGLALAAAIAGLGLVFWQFWLLGLGALAVILAACGLLFEYYSGTRRTAEH
ncbi:cytochrome c oxidase subunit 4 [Verrucosispora sp. WMMD703]|uniref:Cytochrome c oxidase polypeptide 4 n=1 Tax=Micromonospora sediminimaris TaxID=547162 RepID=A0A9W5UNF7_9ACTN|nr:MULTISPECIES: cytochrome c oxidase subunit 4 [Micromonospora]MBQ1051356.1 cytochrome c oxidase subunit 4 [Micromonospora sp. C51]GIJ31689.1 cytochrome c oxidase polypeptide 4 [Micromonospora sediminimaris]SFB79437.1 Cytochrome c oxidase subunit IV [Micromonospora sediminimaris]